MESRYPRISWVNPYQFLSPRTINKVMNRLACNATNQLPVPKKLRPQRTSKFFYNPLALIPTNKCYLITVLLASDICTVYVNTLNENRCLLSEQRIGRIYTLCHPFRKVRHVSKTTMMLNLSIVIQACRLHLGIMSPL